MIEPDLVSMYCSTDVVKISGHSEKPKNIGGISQVHRVHPPLYKISIGARGTFKAPNDNKVGTEDPMYQGIYPASLRDPHHVYKREGAPLV